jgi:hypothetical protein
MKTAFAVLTLAVAASAANYPAKYPTEVPIPDLVAATPESGNSTGTKYTDADTGGYMYTFMVPNMVTQADFDEYGGHYSFALGTRTLEYALVTIFGAPPALPISVWNCSAKLADNEKPELGPLIYVDGDFTGLANGAKICTVGSCCKRMIGKEKYDSSQMDHSSKVDDWVGLNGCQGNMPEDMYCTWVSGHTFFHCIERFLTPTDRDYIDPCIDVSFSYWMDCSVMKTIGMTNFAIDPPPYMELLSPQQNIIHQAGFLMHPDRICTPCKEYGTCKDHSPFEKDAKASSSAVVSMAVLAVIAMLF